MDSRKETSGRNPVLKEVFYLIVCGCLFAGATWAWRHFHSESYQKDPAAHEQAQKLTDH
jgi:hypothetical protein